jgi:uncharacterized membrane protein
MRRDISSEEELDSLVSEARTRAAGEVHYPNHISRPLRRRHLLQALAVAAYAINGLWFAKIVLPIKAHVLVFEGRSAVVLGSAMLMAALNILSVVADHYDKRDNEAQYERFAQITRVLAWVLLGLATVLHLSGR